MTLIIGFLIPLLGTMLGAAFVFFMKDDLSPRVQKTLLGFASGVMVAASVWSLLIPAMEMVADSGKWSVLPAAAGFLLGHINSAVDKCEVEMSFFRFNKLPIGRHQHCI